MKPPRKVQRAFHGMVGRDDPNDVAPAPTPSPIAAPKPVVSVVPVAVPRGGISHLASQAYRARRDPMGKVIEEDPNMAAEFQFNRVRAAWRSALQSEGVNLYVKCVHGHMYSEHYCEVCRFQPIDPDYDPENYRAEIGKALTQARKSLGGDEGKKDLRDLLQIVDIELWRASKKYGTEMNAALAYTIAKSQAGKFITQRIQQQMVESIDPEGNPILVPRFTSMDDKPVDDNGNEVETVVEVAVVEAEHQDADFSPIQIEQLQTLVAGWHGQKRLVGDAMLRPNFSVRSVPGIPKSTVARIRQVVLKEFKAFILKGLKK